MNSVSRTKLFATFVCAWLNCTLVFAQTALVQFIHNSPDPTIASVNVRVQNETLLDSLNFHHAGAMLPIDTSSLAVIGVYALHDTSFQFPLITDTVDLQTGSKHIFILNGMSDGLLFNPNQPLRLDHLDQARDLSEFGNGLDITFCHGATDVDSIDIAESALFELTAFESVASGNFTDYLSLFTADYAFAITHSQTQQLIGNYAAPFGSLNWAGKAVTVISSGFTNQIANSNGLPFGLWATTRDGGPLICLQPDTIGIRSPLQLVNHAAGGAAGDIRISVNDTDWSTSLPVHSATAFQDFPSAQPAVIKIHSNLIQGPIDSIWCDTLQLFSGQSYRAFFFGSGTPDQPYALRVIPFNQANGIPADSISIDFFQGAGCFSEMSIEADTTNQTTLFNQIPYGELSPAISITAGSEEWIAANAGDSLTTWSTPTELSAFAAQHLTLLTHTNADCTALTAWLLTETGGPLSPLELLFIPPPAVFAEVQFIHASADTALNSLALYINDSLFIPTFDFRTSSEMLRIAVNDTLHISLFHPTDTAATNLLYEYALMLEANSNYRLVLAGVSSAQGYNPAPLLRWITVPAMNQPASGNCSLQFVHGVTDVGNIRVEESTTPIVPFFSAVSFGEHSYTNSLAANDDYALGIYNDDVNFLYGIYALPLNGWSWADSAVTLLASGFRQPLNNSNGPSFALHAITAQGEVIPLSDYVSVDDISIPESILCYPNPASEFLTIEINTREADEFNIQLINAQGRTVQEQSAILGIESSYVRINTEDLPSGVYHVNCFGKKTLLNNEQQQSIIIQRK